VYGNYSCLEAISALWALKLLITVESDQKSRKKAGILMGAGE
jgi:hypothetical protein